MGKTEFSVAILGGGIRGAAIAALLAQARHCQVRLFEKERIAAGATSTNHGRLHSGTSLWRSEAPETVRRRWAGLQLLHRLSGVVLTRFESLHFIENSEDLATFEQFCQQFSISCKPVPGSVSPPGWMNENQFAGIYEIPEYAFNPARLAARLVAHVIALGGEVFSNAPVVALDQGRHHAYRLLVLQRDFLPT